MSSHNEILLRVSGAIADGQAVDWIYDEITDQELRAKLERLEALDRIRQAGASEDILRAETTEPTVRLRNLVSGAAVATAAPTSWGPLQVFSLIGTGGIGDVYEAFDPKLERRVALKLLRETVDAEHARRYLAEARRLAKVAHPNVLTIHHADIHDGRVGLWTELVRGQNLEERLRADGPLSATEAANVGVDVCRALAAVHSKGLVHGDLKLANILREQGGKILLTDFGCAHSVLENDHDPRRNSSGTPICMAPELFFGQGSSPRSDVYSMGVALYRMVSGHYPVEASTLRQLREKHRRREKISLAEVRPDLPQTFIRIVEKALAHDPEMRHNTAAELASELDAMVHGPVERRRRTWLLAPIAAVLVLLIWQFWPNPNLDVDVTLLRKHGDSEERLLPNAAVYPGDSLFLELDSNRDVYVYILNEDTQGNRYLLFPLDSLDLQNPVPAGEAIRLPGDGQGIPKSWSVTEAGGRDAILVIASRQRLEHLEEVIAVIPQAGSEDIIALSEQMSRDVVRGLGGLASDPSVTPPNSSLTQIAASFDLSAQQGVWMRALEVISVERVER